MKQTSRQQKRLKAVTPACKTKKNLPRKHEKTRSTASGAAKPVARESKARAGWNLRPPDDCWDACGLSAVHKFMAVIRQKARHPCGTATPQHYSSLFHAARTENNSAADVHVPLCRERIGGFEWMGLDICTAVTGSSVLETSAVSNKSLIPRRSCCNLLEPNEGGQSRVYIFF